MMQKHNFYFKLSIYILLTIAGLAIGYNISLRDLIFIDGGCSPIAITTTNVTSEKNQMQTAYNSDYDCLNKEIIKISRQYGFDNIDEKNWNDFVVAVKTKHLDSFEKEMGINYFQIITLSGDITKAKKYFSMSKADINQSDITGMTPITYAARYLDLNAIKALHLNGADISSGIIHIPKARQRDKTLREISLHSGVKTPLKMAILRNDPVKTPEIIRYFLDNGAEFTNGNDYLFRSLLYADIMDEFLPDILENTSLQKVIIPGRYSRGNAVSTIFSYDKTGTAIEYLFEKGLSPEKHESEYSPVLSAAIRNWENSSELIMKLIDTGFDVNKQALNVKDDTRVEWLTPMWYAINRNDLKIVEILLQNGATVSPEVLKKVNGFSKDKKNKYLDLFREYNGGLN